jgi:hypothetical protein
MDHAAPLPGSVIPRSIVTPLLALAIGAAAATGAYALLDDEPTASAPARVIEVAAPAAPGPGVSAKDEAATAAAVGAGTVELRGSKASATGTTGATESGGVELRGSKASAAGAGTADEPTPLRPGRLGPSQ